MKPELWIFDRSLTGDPVTVEGPFSSLPEAKEWLRNHAAECNSAFFPCDGWIIARTVKIYIPNYRQTIEIKEKE